MGDDIVPPCIYLIGSLRNPEVPVIARALRKHGFDVFDDWYAAGPEADDIWREYEQARGHDFSTALDGWHAEYTWAFDTVHLDRANAGVLVLPAGRSGHMELGFLIGQGKPGYILLDEENPPRWDIMYRFATVAVTLDKLIEALIENLIECPF